MRDDGSVLRLRGWLLAMQFALLIAGSRTPGSAGVALHFGGLACFLASIALRGKGRPNA